MAVIVGIDLGGTKTRVVAEEGGDVVLDVTVPTREWQAGSLLEDPGNPRRLLQIFGHLPHSRSACVVIGAHGLDSRRQVVTFNDQISGIHGGPVLAVNDVELIAPAAGVEAGIAVIAGTGSKVVGHDTSGNPVSAGGYGFILGDPGSAPGLAREAVRAVLDAEDRGETPDVLARNLMALFGAQDVPGLAYRFSASADLQRWAQSGPVIFASADAGSTIAATVIDEAARLLARDVARVRARGAVGTDVLCAGGVMTHQPRLFHAIAHHIDDLQAGLRTRLLTVPPVMGAVALAKELSTQPLTVTNGGSR